MTIEDLIEELNLFLGQEDPFEPAILDIIGRIYRWIYFSVGPAEVPITELNKQAKLKYPRLANDLQEVKTLRIAPLWEPQTRAKGPKTNPEEKADFNAPDLSLFD